MAADGRSRATSPISPLRDIYEALGEPSLLAIGNRTEAPGCLVEQAVNAALDPRVRRCGGAAVVAARPT